MEPDRKPRDRSTQYSQISLAKRKGNSKEKRESFQHIVQEKLYIFMSKMNQETNLIAPMKINSELIIDVIVKFKTITF